MRRSRADSGGVCRLGVGGGNLIRLRVGRRAAGGQAALDRRARRIIEQGWKPARKRPLRARYDTSTSAHTALNTPTRFTHSTNNYTITLNYSTIRAESEKVQQQEVWVRTFVGTSCGGEGVSCHARVISHLARSRTVSDGPTFAIRTTDAIRATSPPWHDQQSGDGTTQQSGGTCCVALPSPSTGLPPKQES